MEHYAGLDVSLELTSACIVDARGMIISEAKVASEPEAPIGFLHGQGLAIGRVGPGTEPLSQWLHAGLVAAGFEAVLLETRHLKAALSAMTVKMVKPQCPQPLPCRRRWKDRLTVSSDRIMWQLKADPGQKQVTSGGT